MYWLKNRFRIIGKLIIFIGIIFTFYIGYTIYITYKINQKRKINFPQKKKYVDQLPHPDSLYIFIMAGQSNMAGRGLVEPQDTILNKKILTIDKSMNWIYAKEPLHFHEPSQTGLDCGMSFAKKLLNSIPDGFSIALIPCAVGGSSVEKWVNNETYRGIKLLDNFKEKVDFSIKRGTIKGIIWHQGEANATPEFIPKYSQMLDSLINKFRFLVKNDTLPIILGELGSYSQPIEKQMKWDAINTIIKDIATKDENIELVKTRDLTNKGDNVHFNSESLRKTWRKICR